MGRTSKIKEARESMQKTLCIQSDNPHKPNEQRTVFIGQCNLAREDEESRTQEDRLDISKIKKTNILTQ